MSEPLILKIKRELKELKESLKIEELFYENTASYVSATLKKSITNYKIILIVGQSTNGNSCIGGYYIPFVGCQISLKETWVDNGTEYRRQAIYKISGEKTIEAIQNSETVNNNVTSGNYIKLKAVLGINF